VTLSGRTAIVTGVSRRIGIGYAIVRRLRELGATVVAAGWTPHDEAQPWGPDPVDFETIELDLARPDAPAQLVGAAPGASVLVVNHARSGRGRLGELSAEELDGYWAVNVRSALLLVQEFAAGCEGDGSVVLMTSGAHLAPMAREVGYAVTKGALAIATKTLAAELAPRITVNCVNPGPTDTGWDIGDPPPGLRWGEPDDAARAVAWLCGEGARWITGQVIDATGPYAVR